MIKNFCQFYFKMEQIDITKLVRLNCHLQDWHLIRSWLKFQLLYLPIPLHSTPPGKAKEDGP